MEEENKTEVKSEDFKSEAVRKTRMLQRLTWANVALAVIVAIIHWCSGNLQAGTGWTLAALAWCDLARERWWSVRMCEELYDSQTMLRRSVGILDRVFGGIAVAVTAHESEHNGCPTHPGESVPEVVTTKSEVADGKAEEE